MHGRSATLKLKGDVTALDAQALRKEITDLIQGKPHDYLIINMSRVNYIDSAGLGVLISAMRRLREVGGTVKLCGLQPRVKAVLDITGMTNAFEIYDGSPDDPYARSITEGQVA